MTIVSKNGDKRIRVGIIGANPDRGWAAQAHIPALKSLSDDFEITALSTSRRESADAASKLFGVPVAFDNHQDLVNSAIVDVVAITVKVPYHLELATAALDAGKAVYCEWPLGNGLKEAETLAALAKKKGVLAVAGLQARSAAHRRRRPSPDLRNDHTRRQRRAVLARSSARAREVLVVAAAGPFHQRRPGVRAFRPRLSRGNAFVPYV